MRHVMLYCTCGAALDALFDGPEQKEIKLREIWIALHSDPGHRPTDARTAARARQATEWPDEA